MQSAEKTVTILQVRSAAEKTGTILEIRSVSLFVVGYGSLN